MREISRELQEKFSLDQTFTLAFMDSFSQSGPNLNDQVQQEHWQEETAKLWTAATGRNETFDFKTIDDVLEENAKCKEENDRLNNIIDQNITELYEVTSANAQRLDLTELDVTENRNAISVNTDDISDLETESKLILSKDSSS